MRARISGTLFRALKTRGCRLVFLSLQMAQAAGLPEELVSKAKQSRSEKKARKAMSKLGTFSPALCSILRYFLSEALICSSF